MHEDDFDLPDANWIDVTTVSRPYQIEVDATRLDTYRHRKIVGNHVHGPWIRGLPDEND